MMDFDCQQLSCTFSLRTYHEMLVWEEFSTTTTLDGVPFLLTERLVWRYINQSWEFAGQLTHPRTSPVILSVPEDWLCFGSVSWTYFPSHTLPPPSHLLTVEQSAAWNWSTMVSRAGSMYQILAKMKEMMERLATLHTTPISTSRSQLVR